MGLNVFKWLYELGVKHERNRIAAELRHLSVSLVRESEYLYEAFGEKKPTVDQRAELAKMEYARKVIDSVLRADDKYVRGESIMFPKGEK